MIDISYKFVSNTIFMNFNLKPDPGKRIKNMWYEIDPLIVVKISRFFKGNQRYDSVLHSTANIKKVRFQESGFEIK